MRQSLVLSAAVVSGLLILASCGKNSSDLTYEEFVAKINSVAIRKGDSTNGHLAIVTKDTFISTFGDPPRVEQPPSGTLFLYYPLKEGTAKIEAIGRFWNGSEHVKLSESTPPFYPVRAELESHAAKSSDGSSDLKSPEYKQALVNWWQSKGHGDKWEVVKDEFGRNYIAKRNGKYEYLGQTTKEGNEQVILNMTVDEAEQGLGAEESKYRIQYEADHTKTIDEPCLVIAIVME